MSQSHGQDLDVLEMNEVYEEDDGKFQCIGTVIVHRLRGDLFHAFSSARNIPISQIRLDQLVKNEKIPQSAYTAPFSSEFTKVPDPLPPNCYVKKPSLISWDGARPNAAADDFLTEARVCELLRKHPHPNFAQYLGCEVSKSRINGLCFTKYPSTLMRIVNPGHSNKRKSKLSRQGQNIDYTYVIKGIQNGIAHLHSLGLVHNDINPSNIMLEGRVPVILDFGSCRTAGESLLRVGRTYEWHDETVNISMAKNDLDALDEIRIWLSGDSSPFLFAE